VRIVREQLIGKAAGIPQGYSIKQHPNGSWFQIVVVVTQA
jgi:hypothetical protein